MVKLLVPSEYTIANGDVPPVIATLRLELLPLQIVAVPEITAAEVILFTVKVAVLFTEIADTQPLRILFIVIIVEPVFTKDPVVKVPEPAVETVIEAVYDPVLAPVNV
jgi:hypothetical protein